MPINDALIAELTREAGTTRRVLERIPEEKLSWTPHPRSMPLGTLGLHIAMLPGAIADLVSPDVIEVPSFTPPAAESLAHILSSHDQSVAKGRQRLASWRDDDLMKEWRLTSGGQPLLALPRIDAVRSLMFNHVYHHRGQLTVFLRLLNVPLPSVYGPTADESPFG